jgi:hypothetical protein
MTPLRLLRPLLPSQSLHILRFGELPRQIEPRVGRLISG